MKTYTAGVDIGSTTVKLVLLDERGTMVFGKYRRHHAHTQQTLAQLLVNKAKFDSLTPEQQDAMRQAADEIVEPQVMAVKELDATVLKHLDELGIPVVTPSDAFKAELAAAFKPVVEQYEAVDPLIADFSAKAKTLTPAAQ